MGDDALTGGMGHGGAKKPMGPEQLLETTEQLYRAFNPAQVTLDTHVDRALAEAGVSNSFDDVFIRQVLYGVVRYRQFLGCLMDSFYYYNSGVANRDDRDMYKVMAYLSIFRLEELGFANFRRLIDAKKPQKMVVFFRYLFNESYLKEAVRDDWLKLYDKEFVDEVIGKLLTWKFEMSKILESLEETVYLTRSPSKIGTQDDRGLGGDPSSSTGPLGGGGSSLIKASTRGPTVPAPFALSQPRPKPLPTLDPPPPPLALYKPPPKVLDGPTKDELAIQAARESNRRAAEDRLANAAPFKLRVLERPTNLDQIRAEIEADIARQLTFQPFSKPRPPPPSFQPAPVKLNAAAILREDALYKKKQQAEAEALKAYESQLRDASEFKAWRAKVMKMDEAERAASVERRRIEMAESQEAAIRAKQRQVEVNQAIGRELKAEAKLIEEAREKEKEEEVKVKQAMREAVLETRGNAAVAAEKVSAEKWSVAEEERQKRARDTKLLAEQEIRDLAEKRDIIMQLRALERVPRQRFKTFDPTDGPDHGLLDTMTLIELQERLKVTRRRKQEEEELQRNVILKGKLEKEEVLRAKVANIQRVRRAAAAQGQGRREQRVRSAAEASAEVASRHEDDVLDLHRKLEEKKGALAADRARIAAEEKKIKFEQMQQAAGAAAVEENKFRELRVGAQRELALRQAAKQAAATVYEETKAKATSVRMRNVKAQTQATKNFLSAYDEKIAQLLAEAQREQDRDSTLKKTQALTRHAEEMEKRAKHEAEMTRLAKGHGTASMQSRLQALAAGQELLPM